MGARIHFESAHTAIPSNNITGNGTINQVAKFTGANVIGDGLITDNGTSVGIGAAASIAGTLAVTGAATLSSTISAVSLTTSGNNTLNNSGGRAIDATSTGVLLAASTAAHDVIFGDNNVRYFSLHTPSGAASMSIRNFNTSTDILTCLEAGNVGIGTTAPTVKLDVESGVEGSNAGFAGLTYGVRIDNGGTFSTGASTIHGVDSTLMASYQPLRLNGSFTALCVGNTEIVRATANGVTFNGDTAAANALDDYEEGTWTMGVSFGGAAVGVTTSANTGTYTKIGRQVTVNGYLKLTSKGSSIGTASITGLPFTIGNGSAFFTAASSVFFNLTFANQFQIQGTYNTTTMELFETTEAGVLTNITAADFANNTGIVLSLTYFV